MIVTTVTGTINTIAGQAAQANLIVQLGTIQGTVNNGTDKAVIINSLFISLKFKWAKCMDVL